MRYDINSSTNSSFSNCTNPLNNNYCPSPLQDSLLGISSGITFLGGLSLLLGVYGQASPFIKVGLPIFCGGVGALIGAAICTDQECSDPVTGAASIGAGAASLLASSYCIYKITKIVRNQAVVVPQNALDNKM